MDITHYDKNGRVVATETASDNPVDVAEATIRDDADKALDGLRTIATSTGTLTGAQLSHAVRLLARVTIHLVRLQLRRLDATD